MSSVRARIPLWSYGAGRHLGNAVANHLHRLIDREPVFRVGEDVAPADRRRGDHGQAGEQIFHAGEHRPLDRREAEPDTEAKPRTDFTRLSAAARGVVKQIRLHLAKPKREGARDPLWRGQASRASSLPAGRETVHMIAIPRAAARNRPVAIETALTLEVPKLYRRVELELSTETRHIARLRYRTPGVRAGALTLRFRGTVTLDGADAVLRLEARPSRQFRRWDDRRVAARYGAIPFALLAARIGGAPAEPAAQPAAALGRRAAPG